MTWEQRKLGEVTSLITKDTTPLDKSDDGDILFSADKRRGAGRRVRLSYSTLFSGLFQAGRTEPAPFISFLEKIARRLDGMEKNCEFRDSGYKKMKKSKNSTVNGQVMI